MKKKDVKNIESGVISVKEDSQENQTIVINRNSIDNGLKEILEELDNAILRGNDVVGTKYIRNRLNNLLLNNEF
jgi:6-pyruvoyl-tetrahydropterin synthase